MKKDMLGRIGRFIVRLLYSLFDKDVLKSYLIKAGYREIPYREVGSLFLISIIGVIGWYAHFVITAGLASMGLFAVILVSPVILLIAFGLIILLLYMMLKLFLEVKAYNRTQSIEQSLPFFLRDFSTNLKAGREFVDALESSTEPELGSLDEDIKEMVVQIRAGKMIERVFEEYIMRYDSTIIEETFQIILDAYKGGSGLGDIIDKIAENLEVIYYLRKEAIANVSSYIIFMGIVSLIIAPLLFALSFNLLSLIHTLLTRVVSSGGSGYMPAQISNININFDDFKLFSQIAVAVIAASAAAVIGIIRKGSLKGSSILIFSFTIIAITVYMVLLFLLQMMFATLYKGV
jgi:hypothetical protein